MSRDSRGQQVMEYVVVIAVVIVVLVVMGYYVRNTLSGKYREAGDAFGQGEQFVPAP